MRAERIGVSLVGIVVVSHSAKLAEGVVELARQMGGGDVALAAAGGIDDPESPIGTDAFAIKEAIESAWSDDGVLVLMDLGSAIMNAETALEFLEPPADASRVLLCEAPLVEGTVAAVATAGIGASLSEVAAEARAGLTPKIEHLAPAEAAESEATPEVARGRSIVLRVGNPLGLHLRPASRLVETVGRFDAEVRIANRTTGSDPVPARSLARVSALGVRQGHEIEVWAAGPDADAALSAISDLAADDFGDRDLPAAPPPPKAETPAVEPRSEGTVVGVGASPGVAVGPARYLRRPALEVPTGPPADPEADRQRLRQAIDAVRADIESQREQVLARAGEAEADIFTAHLLILDDEHLIGSALERIGPSTGAAEAWQAATEAVADDFRRLEDPYQAQRADDVEAVGRQVLARLLGVDPRPRMEAPGVLVADDLTPGETATLDPEMVQAIVTAAGAPTSHSAILARGLGVPAVVAAGPLEVEEGTPLLVDGTAGSVVIDPPPEQVAEARRRAEEDARRLEEARSRAAAPAVTTDGVAIEVAANIGSVEDARAAVEAGADGVGLLRTEFLYLNRTTPPSEEEQEETYRQIAEALGGRPLVLRTLDVGGDKPLPFLPRPPEQNPFLGVRGLRLGLAEPELLMSQVRAALRVAATHPVRIMFPMVSVLSEWEQVRTMVGEAAEQIGGLPDGLQIGVMVEVPSLALAADRFAAVVDFFSIGTNDLTQYTLAAERGNPELANLADALHPSVLSLIDRTCRAAAEHGRWVGVCGEAAGDPLAVPILVGLGVTELSMSPVAIAQVKDVVRRIDASDARRLAASALEMTSAEAVRQAAAAFLGT